MSQFTGDIEQRWYGETSNTHGRVIHFRSSIGDDYWRTGTGSALGIRNSFTLLSNHTANLPASISANYSNRGDFAFTEFPYFRAGNEHWAIRGESDRWEVDDFTGNDSQDTIHRVWVRQASPLVVTNTNDSGEGSLRQAITTANADTALDNITFDIPGAGPHAISPATPLPTIADDGITIDGSTQGLTVCGGATNGTGGLTSRKLRVALFGDGHSSDVLRVAGASNVTIKGLVFGSGTDDGLQASNADGLTLLCNHFGTTTDATGDVGNAFEGTLIQNSNNVLIGDGTLGGANVFGYNGASSLFMFGGSNAILRNNFFGISIDGSATVPNGGNGISLGNTTNATVGGTTSGDQNIIGANNLYGIGDYGTSGTKILGNYIGTNGIGTATRLNSQSGVFSTSSSNIEIGRVGAGNVITSPSISGAIWSRVTTTGTIIGNSLGVTADGTTALGTPYSGIYADGSTAVTVGDGTAVGANVMQNGVNGGIVVTGSARVASLRNRIFNNSGLGIDITSGTFGVTPNDANDGDTDVPLAL